MVQDSFEDLLQPIRDGRLNRRQFMQAAAIVGVAAAGSLAERLGPAGVPAPVTAAPVAPAAGPVRNEDQAQELFFDRTRFIDDPGVGGWLRSWSVRAKSRG